MPYTNEGEVEKFLGVDISGLSSWITDLATAVDNWINNYTGKEFVKDTDDRYFDGNGKGEIIIDSFTGTPTVVILEHDGTTLYNLTEGQDEDYITYPLNTTEKNKLVLTNNSKVSTWISGIRRIKITADWGAAVTVPKDIQLAATMLVAKIIEKPLKGGQLSQVKLGEYSANFRKIDEVAEAMGIYNILDKYREIEI